MTAHPLQDEIDNCRYMLACPHYRGTGGCSNGCVSEPYCQTGEPLDGWEAEIRRLLEDDQPEEGTR